MRSLKALFAAVFISVAIIFIGNYNVLADEEPTLKDFYEINDYEDLYDGGFHNIEIKPIEIEPAALTFDESSGGSIDAGSGYEYPVEPAVYYSTDGTNYGDENPAFKDAGEYTVYYKLTAGNYEEYKGSAKVKISARPFSITVSDQTIKYGEAIDSSKYTVAASETMPAPDAGDDILRYIIAEGETLSVTLSVQDGATIVPEIKIVDSSNEETTDNYYITCTPGTLTYELVSPTLSGISATAITYGKTLANSTISGTATYGDDTVAGTFAFDAPDTAPAVADPAAEYAFTFTPDENVAKYFNSVSGNVSVTVTPVNISGATVILSANQLTYSDSEQTVSVTSVTLGDAILLTDDYEVSGNTGAVPGSYTVTVTGKGNYSGSATSAFSIDPATPTLSDIEATSITWGEDIEESTISGVAKFGNVYVAGTWSFDNPALVPENAGTYTYDVTFTPNGDVAELYTTASGKVSVTVEPVSIEGATVDLTTNSFYYTGSEQTVSVESVILGSVRLSTDDYEVSGNTVTDVGTYNVTVTGKGNYSGSATAAFTIRRKSLTLSDIKATAITLGDALSASTITGVAKFNNEVISGTWSFKNPDTTPANAGTENYDVIFTPDNGALRKNTSASDKVSVKVNRISIKGAKVTLSAKTLNFSGSLQTVSVTSVELGDVVLSTDCYKVSGNTGTEAGSYTVTVTGKGNYSGSATATFRIIKAVPAEPVTPILSDIAATEITWGEPLYASSLSGKATVDGVAIPGTFRFDNLSLFPESVGIFEYDVTFTPNNSVADLYTSASGKVSVTVNPISISGAIVTLSKNELTYTGSVQTVSVTSVKLGDAVLLTDDYEVSGNTGTVAGNYIVTVKGKGNYAGTATATFLITPATPKLSDISATAITLGDALSKSTISGVAKFDGKDISGTWSFDAPEFVPQNVGTSTYDVIFTPADDISKNFTSESGTVSITVNPVSIDEAVVTLNTDVLTYTGSEQTVSVTSVTLGDVILSTDCYEISGNTGTAVGPYTVTITGKGNYAETATATFLITLATPKLSDISATAITLGDALSKSTISGVAKVNNIAIQGTWSFVNPELIPENAGTSTYAVTFTPDDSIADSYTSVSSSVSVTVNPLSISGATVILSKNELTYTGSEQTVSVTSVKLGDDVLSPDCYDVSNNTGTAVGSYTVTITGNGNYAGTTTATFEIINPAPKPGSESHGPITPVLSNISATSISWGDALNKSTITGKAEANGVEVPGTWSFTTPDTKPENIGTYSYEARFTPSDTTNYSSVTTSVSVTVNRGVRTVPGSLSADSVSTTSVSLTNLTNCEYSMNGTDWQDSYTFTGLNPDTEYNFYARYKKSLNYTITDESAYTSVTVKTATHTHEWTFKVSDGTIIATCANGDHGHEGELTQIIVIKASNRNYNGKAMTANVIGSIDGIVVPEITYKKGNKVLKNAPVDAGTYTANISIIDEVNNKTITASKTFKINKAKYKIIIQLSTKSISVKAKSLNNKAYTKRIIKKYYARTADNKKLNSGKIKIKIGSGSTQISLESGKELKVAKYTKKGTYTKKIKFTVAGDKNHKTTTKTITIKVNVK